MRRDRQLLETLLLHQCLRKRATAGDLALTLLEAQAARGTLDVAACREALAVCSRSGAWREALGLLGHLEQQGEWGGAEFGHAIRACAAGGQYEQMWQLAGRAEAEAGPPDMPTLTAMMQACRRAKDPAGAEALWKRMCAAMATPPEPDGLSAYLMLCADQGQWQRAHTLLREAKRAGLQPSRKHWNVVLSACVRSGAMAEAERLLDLMPESVRPDAVSFNTLLHGYAQLWVTPGGEDERTAAAEALLGRMREAGVRPTEVTYNALLDLHRFEVGQAHRFSSAVSCHGGDSVSARRCRFRNLCYHIVDESFLFSHHPESPAVLKGVPTDRFDPALAEFSSVANHNGTSTALNYFHLVPSHICSCGFR